MDKGNPLKPTQFELQFVDSIDQVYLGKGASEISGSQILNLLPCYSFTSYRFKRECKASQVLWQASELWFKPLLFCTKDTNSSVL